MGVNPACGENANMPTPFNFLITLKKKPISGKQDRITQKQENRRTQIKTSIVSVTFSVQEMGENFEVVLTSSFRADLAVSSESV